MKQGNSHPLHVMVIITIFHLLKKKSKQQNTIKGGKKKAPPNPNKPTNSNNGVFITGPGLELAKYFFFV